MPLQLRVITAERVVLEETGVDEVLAPGMLGELGILPMHAALVTTLAPGELRVSRAGQEMSLSVAGGFLEVKDDRVTVLADAAERAEEIDVARAAAARRRAEAALASRRGEVDLAATEAALRRAVLRLRVAERVRRRRGGGLPPTTGTD